MQRYLRTFATLSVFALAACGDALGPGNASEEDRAELIAILDESGWFVDTFGPDGAVADFSIGTGFDLGLAASVMDSQDDVPLVRLWGRRDRQVVDRVREVVVEENQATVTWTVSIEGQFVLDRTDDGQVNPTSKPLAHDAVQVATFERRETADERGRRWRLVGVSPREWRMTNADARTMTIDRIELFVNGASLLVIEDPSAALDVDGRMPRLEVGDEVSVVAQVTNANDLGNTPPEFVFLHLFHAGPNARAWIRLRMMPNANGDYVREWTVRHRGRERIIIDAIDSQAFATDSGDDYRAHLIGIPYRVGSDDQATGDGA